MLLYYKEITTEHLGNYHWLKREAGTMPAFRFSSSHREQ
jgi:hypothetical protein